MALALDLAIIYTLQSRWLLLKVNGSEEKLSEETDTGMSELSASVCTNLIVCIAYINLKVSVSFSCNNHVEVLYAFYNHAVNCPFFASCDRFVKSSCNRKLCVHLTTTSTVVRTRPSRNCTMLPAAKVKNGGGEAENYSSEKKVIYSMWEKETIFCVWSTL